MIKLTLSFISIFMLTACGNSAADHALAQQNFGRLMGKPVDQAVEIFGPADRIIDKPTGRLYQWTTLKRDVATEQLAAGYDPDAEHGECTISALTRSDGTIRRGRIIGNVKSCARYDDALNNYFPSRPNGGLINRSYLRRADENNTN